MTDRAQILAAMQKRLETAGLGFESLKVFGAIRINVHVVCVSRETAEKWGRLLAQALHAKPTIVPTTWDAAENKGTNLRPTKRAGYLIAIAA